MRQPTSPSLTRDLASTFRSAIERAGLSFKVQCDELDEPFMSIGRCGRRSFSTCCRTRSNSRCRAGSMCGCAARSAHAVLKVADTGVGIPEHELPRLFERFHRVEGSRGAYPGGIRYRLGPGAGTGQAARRHHRGRSANRGAGYDFACASPWDSASAAGVDRRRRSARAPPLRVLRSLCRRPCAGCPEAEARRHPRTLPALIETSTSARRSALRRHLWVARHPGRRRQRRHASLRTRAARARLRR